MQASRTAHYAWLYRGGLRGSQQRSQAQGWPTEVAPKPSTTASAFAARAHFIEAQIHDAVESGIRQMVWLGPRGAQSAVRSLSDRERDRVELGVEVEVFRLEAEADTLRAGAGAGAGAGRGARAVLDRSLVRSARTLFVCDGLLDRTPSAQIQAILRMIGESCYGSRLACVYIDGGSVSANLGSGGGQKPRCAVPRLGERTQVGQVGIETRALPALLASANLVLDADIGLSDYVRRALAEVPSDLRGSGCYRLAVAHVRAPALDQADAPLN